MRTRFSYDGDSVVEIVRDGEDVDVVIRSATPVTPIQEVRYDTLPPDVQQLQVAQPLPEAVPVAEKPSKGIAALIRGMWTFIIAMFVEGGSYAVSNLTSVSLPPGVGLVGGALLQGAIYATKKRAFPDTQF